jgi:hypothetical protein
MHESSALKPCFAHTRPTVHAEAPSTIVAHASVYQHSPAPATVVHHVHQLTSTSWNPRRCPPGRRSPRGIQPRGWGTRHRPSAGPTKEPPTRHSKLSMKLERLQCRKKVISTIRAPSVTFEGTAPVSLPPRRLDHPAMQPSFHVAAASIAHHVHASRPRIPYRVHPPWVCAAVPGRLSRTMYDHLNSPGEGCGEARNTAHHTSTGTVQRCPANSQCHVVPGWGGPVNPPASGTSITVR